MKKIYSIGYLDNTKRLTKIWDTNGNTLKFSTIEEAKKYIDFINNSNGVVLGCRIYQKNNYSIYQGFKKI